MATIYNITVRLPEFVGKIFRLKKASPLPNAKEIGNDKRAQVEESHVRMGTFMPEDDGTLKTESGIIIARRWV